MKGSKPLLWILIALVCFAVGFVGFSIYHQQQVYDIQHSGAPALPN